MKLQKLSEDDMKSKWKYLEERLIDYAKIDDRKSVKSLLARFLNEEEKNEGI